MAAEQEEARAGQGDGWMTRKRALIIAAIVLLLGGVAAFALTRPEQVPVPKVTEETQAQAQVLLEDAGFEVEVRPRRAATSRTPSSSRTRAAGKEAEEGSTVEITVSTGAQVAVPDVKGLPEATAAKRLQQEQLLVRTRQAFSTKVKPGRAIGTKPGAGNEVECQSPVTLLVSRGQNLVTLPDVIGLQREEAESQLKQLGFIVDVDTRDADQPEGEVIGQSPGPDSEPEEGDHGDDHRLDRRRLGDRPQRGGPDRGVGPDQPDRERA